MIKYINVDKIWKLFGGCLYNVEVLCWCILYVTSKHTVKTA